MSLPLRWSDIALRLGLAILSGIALGLNRSERGHVAGLRTTVLVSLAAAVAMIQVNLLLVTSGKSPASYSVLDLMRLPLGILTGMGFIGAGAIVRRGEAVSGVTTAAVLWLATVIGLCMGGGQIILGSAVCAAALVSLVLLDLFERRMQQERHARLEVEVAAEGPDEERVKALLVQHGYDVRCWNVSYEGSRPKKMAFDVRWRSRRASANEPPRFLVALAREEGVTTVAWQL